MTTPDPSREAFLRWFAESGMTKFQETAWAAWQAAMAHKAAVLWQPIATAPLDGTRVLLTAMQDKPIAGAGNWVARHKIWLWPYPLVEPTHWAPLPAAPKQEGSI